MRRFALDDSAWFQRLPQPAAAQAYEITWDFLARSGAMRDEVEACVFLAQRVSTMVEDGETNRIRMANRAISAYEHYVMNERDTQIRSGGRCADGSHIARSGLAEIGLRQESLAQRQPYQLDIGADAELVLDQGVQVR